MNTKPSCWVDLKSSLLTLDRADASIALFLLNRSLTLCLISSAKLRHFAQIPLVILPFCLLKTYTTDNM